MKEALTFEDVLLVPQKSNYSPDHVSTEVFLSKKIILKIPIMSSAMDTVTESQMAIALAKAGGMGVIHKNLDPDDQAKEVKKVKDKNLLCAAAVSVGESALIRAEKLVVAGADAIVIDVAHGHFYKVSETIKILKRKYGKKIIIIGGNVVTAKATLDLIKVGADAVKVGVGPGSICTTRIVAGVGMPQLTAIMDAVKAALKTKTPIIADGGIKYSGDMVKALAAGASAVMLGSLLAGTDETPGEVIEIDGVTTKTYRGMGSLEAMQHGSNDRYMQTGRKEAREMIAEGVVGKVPYKGPVGDVIYQLIGGLKQGLGYCGAKDIYDLWKKAEFVRISPAGLRESHPHSLHKINHSPNYKG